MNAIFPIDVLSEGIQEPDRELRQRHQEVVDWPGASLIRDIWS